MCNSADNPDDRKEQRCKQESSLASVSYDARIVSMHLQVGHAENIDGKH